MKREQYKRQLKELQDEFDAEYAEMKTRYEARKQGLALFYGIVLGHKAVAKEAKKRKALLEAIREAIAPIKDEFVVNDVYDELKRRHPAWTINKGQLATAIKRLAEDGEITVIEQGRGRRAGIFEKLKK